MRWNQTAVPEYKEAALAGRRRAEYEKQETYPPTTHGHAIADVQGLQAALHAKQDAGAGGGSGPTVKCGTVNLGAGGSAAVTFAAAFRAVPVVTVTAQFSNADTSCTYSAHTITVNGFTLRGAGNPAGLVGWIATDAGNS